MKKASIVFNIKSWMVFVSSMGGATLICILLRGVSTSDFHVPMIFVLAVLVISLYTDGYFYGILAALSSVFGVNWAFTYPYMNFNFSLPGYLITFVTMLAVGLVTSLLSSRIKAQEKLRIESAAEKMRADLLRSISHDLRTPLTSISGSLSAAIEDDGSIGEDQKRQLLSNAKDEADWLCRIFENLMSITRINGQPGNINKKSELLEELISEVCSTFSKRVPGIAIDVQLPDEPVFVSVDAMLIEQLLINMMDNAVQHGKNTDRITISVSEQGEFISISVQDNGEGIDSAVLAHLFDGNLQMFAESGDKNKYMGIGLQVCKTIAEIHGGTISARNNSRGAEFIVTLKKND